MEGAFSNGMCRCCASEGTFKDVLSKYHWMGEEEIYADMLSDCFDISLTNTTDGGLESGICEVCITQLRNAVNFKKQVLHTEMQFKKKLQEHMFKVNIVKVEVSPLDDAGNDSDNNLSDDYSGPEYDVPIKTEVEVESKPKKRGKATPASKAKKPKVEDAETSTKSIVRKRSGVDLSKVISLLKSNSSRVNIKPADDWSVTIKGKSNAKKIKPTRKPRTKKASKVKKDPKLQEAPKVENAPKVETAPKVKKAAKVKSKGVLNDYLHNVKEILLHTNATPIRRYLGDSYVCGFCNEHYHIPKDLKYHTLKQHNVDDINSFMSDRRLSSFVVKMDITNLQCTICDKSIDNLENLVQHLTCQHERMWHKIDNRILTFKFTNDEISCAICSEKFNSFKLAQSHMPVHYNNFLCGICNAPFISQHALNNHFNRHGEGEFSCSYCSKIFNTITKRNEHEQFYHKGSKNYKCSQCSMQFTIYRQREAHMIQAHGKKPLVLKCLACDKSFSTRFKLNNHTRKDHLMERRNECQLCDMKFFTTSALSRHMLKHTGVKKHKCLVCSKYYARLFTLKEHMRIHTDDRKFKCEHCGKAFVQKCSLKLHLRTVHREIASNL